MIKAWWFKNKQNDTEILQPEWFIPRTQVRVYAEFVELTFPLEVHVKAFKNGKSFFSKSYEIKGDMEESDFSFKYFPPSGVFILKDYVNSAQTEPDKIVVNVMMGDTSYSEEIICEYALISGRITNFEGEAYPAAVIYNLHTFEGTDGGIGTWSDMEGYYSLSLPKTTFHSIFIDDNMYGMASLEAWSWHMIVDRNEVHSYKIGNGEVYSLSVWPNNGGYTSLFIYFRPMVLSYVSKQEISTVQLNGKTYAQFDASPELEIDNISIELNGKRLGIISLQKIIETGPDESAMPAYIIQVERPNTTGKQTLSVEYNFMDSNGEPAQSQGRTQFFYSNVYGLSIN